jgi:hypothetical protein
VACLIGDLAGKCEPGKYAWNVLKIPMMTSLCSFSLTVSLTLELGSGLI